VNCGAKVLLFSRNTNEYMLIIAIILEKFYKMVTICKNVRFRSLKYSNVVSLTSRISESDRLIHRKQDKGLSEDFTGGDKLK
jgi:hypothetical protein